MWYLSCDTAFESLKAILKNSPVLGAPNVSIPFKLAIDASDVALGTVLLQEDANGIDHPVSYLYFSKSCQTVNTVIQQ